MRIRKGRKYRPESRFRLGDFDALECRLLTHPVEVLRLFHEQGIRTLQALPFWGRLKQEIEADAALRIICVAAILGIPEGDEVTA